MSRLNALVVLGLAVVLGTPALASAHIRMLSPAPRDPDNLKQGPCGLAGSQRGEATVVESGSTIELRWEQMYDHPSHYRVSFDADGDDDFVDPTSFDDRYTNDAVLKDGIPTGPGPFSIKVQLPNIECERCTLQLIQVMYDKGEYEPGTDDIYYQCADLVLRRGAPSSDLDGGSAGAFDAGVSSGGGGDGTTTTTDPATAADAGWGSGGPRYGNGDYQNGGGYDTTGAPPSPQPTAQGPAASCATRITPHGSLAGAWMMLGLAALLRRRRAR